MDFGKLIGNENNKQILNEIIKSKNIANGYMFYGISGIGKFLFAKEFAKAILCDEKTGCGKCKSCIEFDSDNNPDFQIISTEENTIKIEQIRTMNNKICEKPITSDRKVYIINDADLNTYPLKIVEILGIVTIGIILVQPFKFKAETTNAVLTIEPTMNCELLAITLSAPNTVVTNLLKNVGTSSASKAIITV